MSYEKSPRWKDEELTPRKALEATIGRAMLSSTHRNGPGGKPGVVVARMGDKYRKALAELRSEDLQDVRVEDISDEMTASSANPCNARVFG